jgi:signal transduction histidine kinase
LISITVEQKKEDGMDVIIVCIKDNGKGIRPEIFPRLFTKFATKSFYDTGLGLYICKNIIKMHSGRIWAQTIRIQMALVSYLVYH